MAAANRRGHLCPSDDRDSTAEENRTTFILTNIVPQAPTHNRQAWQLLEEYARTLVSQGNELYIMAGGYGVGATGSQGYKTILATGKVKPPTQCWKVIVVLPEGDNDLSRINAQSTVIAVDMQNAQTVRNGWEDYIVTIADIEKATQYTFLSALPAATQTALKAKKYKLTPSVTPPNSATTTPPVTVTSTTPPTTATTTPPTTSTVTPPTTTTTTPPTSTTTTPPTTTTVTPPTTTTTTPPSTGTTTSPVTGDVVVWYLQQQTVIPGP